MSNYKKVVLLSLVFSCILFFVGNLLKKESHSIPNPEGHIREVVGQLNQKDLDGFKRLILQKDFFEQTDESILIFYFSGYPGMNESMARFLTLWMHEKEGSVLEIYQMTIANEFETVQKKLKSKGEIVIDRIQWKLVGSSDLHGMYRCNAKIFVHVGKEKYCIRYKNMFYYQGAWYAGNLEDIDKVEESEIEYTPDSFDLPSMQEFMERTDSIETEASEEAVEVEPKLEESSKVEED